MVIWAEFLTVEVLVPLFDTGVVGPLARVAAADVITDRVMAARPGLRPAMEDT